MRSKEEIIAELENLGLLPDSKSVVGENEHWVYIVSDLYNQHMKLISELDSIEGISVFVKIDPVWFNHEYPFVLRKKYESGEVDLIEAAKQLGAKVRQLAEGNYSIDVGDLPEWWTKAFGTQYKEDVSANHT